jgi:L(+)-tartrate dehydratase beta subunit
MEPHQPREFHLTVPLKEEDLTPLRAGDIVYLTGTIFTARDGVYRRMLDEGHPPPIDIRHTYNVTAQSSPAGSEVAPGVYRVSSLQATAGFRYAQWMERLLERYGVRAVVNKGGMSAATYRDVFRRYGAVCLSTMPYGIGAVYGRAVTRVRAVHWQDRLGLSEAMWLLEVEALGPLLVDGDTAGRSYALAHAAEVDGPLRALYETLPELILKRFGEVADPTAELIS